MPKALEELLGEIVSLSPNADSMGQQVSLDEYKYYNRLLDLKSKSDDINARKRFAKRIYCLVCYWMAFVAATVIASGFGYPKLSDGVLIALVSGTTVTVIGLLAIVAKYFFPSKP